MTAARAPDRASSGSPGRRPSVRRRRSASSMATIREHRPSSRSVLCSAMTATSRSLRGPAAPHRRAASPPGPAARSVRRGRGGAAASRAAMPGRPAGPDRGTAGVGSRWSRSRCRAARALRGFARSSPRRRPRFIGPRATSSNTVPVRRTFGRRVLEADHDAGREPRRRPTGHRLAVDREHAPVSAPPIDAGATPAPTRQTVDFPPRSGRPRRRSRRPAA